MQIERERGMYYRYFNELFGSDCCQLKRSAAALRGFTPTQGRLATSVKAVKCFFIFNVSECKPAASDPRRDVGRLPPLPRHS